MSDEMPTTDDVRYAYIEGAVEWYEQEAEKAFDRWLAAHDTATRTAALEEAAVIVRNNFGRSWVAWGTLGHLAAAIRAAKDGAQ